MLLFFLRHQTAQFSFDNIYTICGEQTSGLTHVFTMLIHSSNNFSSYFILAIAFLSVVMTWKCFICLIQQTVGDQTKKKKKSQKCSQMPFDLKKRWREKWFKRKKILQPVPPTGNKLEQLGVRLPGWAVPDKTPPNVVKQWPRRSQWWLDWNPVDGYGPGSCSVGTR